MVNFHYPGEEDESVIEKKLYTYFCQHCKSEFDKQKLSNERLLLKAKCPMCGHEATLERERY